MYTYWRSEPGLWTVGTTGPGGCGPERNRHPESDWGSKDEAAARVHYLNGGGLAGPRQIRDALLGYEAGHALSPEEEAAFARVRAVLGETREQEPS